MTCMLAYNTWCSPVVSHPSTIQARPCLASEIGRAFIYFFMTCMLAYNTWCSPVVSHPSTIQARPCLASEIWWDRACSWWYGRKRIQRFLKKTRFKKTRVPCLCLIWIKLSQISNQIKSNQITFIVTSPQHKVPWWVKFLQACPRRCKMIKIHLLLIFESP